MIALRKIGAAWLKKLRSWTNVCYSFATISCFCNI